MGIAHSPASVGGKFALVQLGDESGIHGGIAGLVGIDDIYGFVEVDGAQPVATGTDGNFVQQLRAVG